MRRAGGKTVVDTVLAAMMHEFGSRPGKRCLGEEFARVYLAMKRQETARLRDFIPQAETDEYFELY